MTLAPTEVPTQEAAPDHVEVLIKEARRRGRRQHLLIGMLAFALIGATVATAVAWGGRGGNRNPTDSGSSSAPSIGLRTSLTALHVPRSTGMTAADVTACPTTNYCAIVGAPRSSTGVRVHAVALDGRSWRSLPSPAGTGGTADAALSCASPGFCVLAGALPSSDPAGTTVAAAQFLEGGRWLTQYPPTPSGSLMSTLESIDCPSASMCLAGGDANTAAYGNVVFVDRWTPAGWKQMSSIQPRWESRGEIASVSAISCVSTYWCMLLGYYSTGRRGEMLATIWTGGRWNSVSVPRVGPPTKYGINESLSGLDCTSQTTCVAAASWSWAALTLPYTTTEMLEWDGHTWAVVKLGGKLVGPSLNGGTGQLACQSKGLCVTYVAPASFGTGWTTSEVLWLERVSHGWRQHWEQIGAGYSKYLTGVSCAPGGRCLLVGTRYSNEAAIEGAKNAGTSPVVLDSEP